MALMSYLDSSASGRLINQLKLKTLSGTLVGGEIGSGDSGWQPIIDSGSSEPSYYFQTVTVLGLGANDVCFVQHDVSQMMIINIEEMEKDKIRCVGQDTNELDFIAEKLPTFNIPLVVVKQDSVAE